MNQPTPEDSGPAAPRRSWRFGTPYLLGALIFSVVSLEVAVRVLGYRPRAQNDQVDITVEPGGRFFAVHDQLGYGHLPGGFDVTLPNGFMFSVNHDADAYRITRPQDDYLEEAPRDEIWIFGGSFTHGWSVSDNETFPWQVQLATPNVDVRNYGVSGYGTVQAFVQLESLLREGRRPALAVVAYSSLHDERNTFSRTRRESLTRWNHLGPLRQPVARLRGDSIAVELRDMSYAKFPLTRYLASPFAVELAYNKADLSFSRSVDVTKALLLSMARQCAARDVPFVVAGLLGDDATRQMLAEVEEGSVAVVDVSVDLDRSGFRNLPHDRHPSALAHTEYANGLIAYLAAEHPALLE